MYNKVNTIMEMQELIIPVDSTSAGNEIHVDLGAIKISSDGVFHNVEINGHPAKHVLGGCIKRLQLEMDVSEKPKLTLTIIPTDLESDVKQYKIAKDGKDTDNAYDDDYDPGVSEDSVFPFSER